MDKVPHGRWKTATFLAACATIGLMRAACSTDPSTANASAPMSNSSSSPTLKPGDVVILDNLGSHKGKAVRTGHPRRRRAPCVPAEILSRSQSDRAGVRQVQDFAAKGRSPNLRIRLQRMRRILAQYPPEESAAYLRNAGYA